MGFILPVETVSFHVWQPCNMHCRYCFATFIDVRRTVLPEGHLDERAAIEAVQLLVNAGFKKITFAGGEPLLCPWIVKLIEIANAGGAQTCLVTNGSLLSERLLSCLEGSLDWLVLSIDSLKVDALRLIGRTTRGRALEPETYIRLCQQVSQHGISLRINTVVSTANLAEDFSTFIFEASPTRWKLLQVLPISGQNSDKVDPYLISDAEFQVFVDRHRAVNTDCTTVVVETNDDLTGSYAMLDPAGRFFDNVAGRYTYGDSILQVGVMAAIGQVSISSEKFRARGGDYYLPVLDRPN